MASVTVRSVQGLQQEILAGEHLFYADEPVDLGGGDTGPNPYELLLGSLGACKTITVTMYARRKGWNLQQVVVELSHSRVHRKDCEECEDRDVQIDRITVRISLAGNLTPDQRQRLKEIAARCPVHRTLTGTIEIVDADE